MKKMFCLSLIILSFISFFAMWLFIANSLSRNAQLKILNSSGSDYVCSYYGSSNFDDDFYYMNKSLSLKHNNKKIIAEILMYKADKSYTINPFNAYSTIKDDEIIVSRNVANKYALKLGDVVFVSSSINDDTLEYHIKEIIAPAYCFTEDYFVKDKGIVIVGNSTELVETNNLSLVFVSDKDSLNGISLEKITSIASCKKAFRHEILIDYTVIVGIACFIFFAYFILFEIVFSLRIRKSVINGASPKTIFCQYYLNPIIWSIIYISLIILFAIVESLLSFRMLIVPMTIMSVLIVPILSCIVSVVIMKIRIRRV